MMTSCIDAVFYQIRTPQVHSTLPMEKTFTFSTKSFWRRLRRRHNSLGHMAPLGLAGECYIYHRATSFGKDSNRGRLDQRFEHGSP
ncbi:hypothetical protein E2C01_067798 [Portunus trituberculatus]|uniref:Uncharacterized protein n=1 Tax=Portunus trituberculatus TaxID=210409 RepID=A0A5B7HXR2_PORTR|nr:hypothetical protein [Portunus trituberculatus]